MRARAPLGLLWLLLLVCSSPGAQAASLGKLHVHSFFGAPLLATVEVELQPTDDEDRVIARIASQATHEAFGVPFEPYLYWIDVQTLRTKQGLRLRVRGSRPLTELHLEFVLELRFMAGAVFRSYVVLPELDRRGAGTADGDVLEDPLELPLPLAGQPEPASAEPPAPPIGAGPYTVSADDSLWSIARRMDPALGDLDERMRRLRAANPGLGDGAGLGQQKVLVIPDRTVPDPGPSPSGRPAQARAKARPEAAARPAPRRVAGDGSQPVAPASPGKAGLPPSFASEQALNDVRRHARGQQVVRLRALGGPAFFQSVNGATQAVLTAEEGAGLKLELAEIRRNMERLARENTQLTTEVSRLKATNPLAAPVAAPVDAGPMLQIPWWTAIAMAVAVLAAALALFRARSRTPAVVPARAGLAAAAPIHFPPVERSAVPDPTPRVEPSLEEPAPEAPPPAEQARDEPLEQADLAALRAEIAGLTAALAGPDDQPALESPRAVEAPADTRTSLLPRKRQMRRPLPADPQTIDDIPIEYLHPSSIRQPLAQRDDGFTFDAGETQARSPATTESSRLGSGIGGVMPADEMLDEVDFLWDQVDRSAIKAERKDERMAALSAREADDGVQEPPPADFSDLGPPAIEEPFSPPPAQEEPPASWPRVELEEPEADGGDAPRVEQADDFGAEALEPWDEDAAGSGEGAALSGVEAIEFDQLESFDDAEVAALFSQTEEESAHPVPSVAASPVFPASRWAGLRTAIDAALLGQLEPGRKWALYLVELDEVERLEKDHGSLAMADLNSQLQAWLSSQLAPFGVEPQRIRDNAFTFLCAHDSDQAHQSLGNRLVEDFRGRGLRLASHAAALTISVAAVPLDSAVVSLEDYLEHAGQALAQLRSQGAAGRRGDGAVLYAQRVPSFDWDDEESFLAKLNELLQRKLFDIQYQTLLNLIGTYEQVYLCKAELAPGVDRSTLPENFLQKAFACRATPAIDRYSIDMALNKMLGLGSAEIRMLFRIDVRSAMDPGFVKWLTGRLEGRGVKPASVTLFFYASDVMAHGAAILAFGAQVRAKGIGLGMLNVDYTAEHLQAAVDLGASMVRVSPKIVDEVLAIAMKGYDRRASDRELSNRLKALLTSFHNQAIETIVFTGNLEAVPQLIVLNATNLRASYVQTPVGMIEDEDQARR